MKYIWHCFKSIWKIYDRKMKWIFLSIIFLIFINAIGELFSILSLKILLTNLISGNALSRESVDLLIFRFDSDNILGISLFLLISLFLVFLLKIITLSLITSFSGKTGTIISTRIFSENLLTHYYKYNNLENNFLIASLTDQVNITVTGLMNFFKLISSSIICAFILGGLLINDFYYNILVISFFTLIYFASYKLVKNKLKSNSKIIKKASENRLRIIRNTFGANKEIIANNLQLYFKNLFNKADWPGRQAKAENYVLKIIPKSIIEFFAYSLIISICLISKVFNYESALILSFVGTLAFAIQRLMPQMQTIFASFSYMSGERASILNIFDLIKKFDLNNKFVSTHENLYFKNLSLSEIYFTYDSQKDTFLNKIDITINKGDKIGIIGESGSGKSTLIDLVTGIIKPSKGIVKVNNIDIHKKKNIEYLLKWRNSFSLLTQKPYLFEGSILENISFGKSINEIDIKRIFKSTKQAKIFDFIDSLPNKFLTRLGEDGTNLSGGQAQRICLARALYNYKKILIMDEATSSLDERTEREIVESLKKLSDEMTVIIISHREPILEICNKIINLSDEQK